MINKIDIVFKKKGVFLAPNHQFIIVELIINFFFIICPRSNKSYLNLHFHSSYFNFKEQTFASYFLTVLLYEQLMKVYFWIRPN